MTELAAEIVIAQASHSNLSPEELSEALKEAFATLSRMTAAEDSGGSLDQDADETEPVSDALAKLQKSPKRSIKKNSVQCLECGAKFKMLTRRHLETHGLTPKQYRKKWGFTARQPLSSKAISEKRRETAERLGLADKLAVAREIRAKKAAVNKKAKSLGNITVADGGSVSQALAQLRKTPLRSIKKNEVVCLECGATFKMLTKTHLLTHNLTPAEYKEKWRLGARQALSSKTLSESRRKTAEKLGLGDKLVAAREKKLADEKKKAEQKPKFKPKVVRRKKGD